MLRYLKNVFSIILIYLLSIMIIPNILEYTIRILEKLFLQLQIYRQPIHCSNLMYIVSLMRTTRFKNLDFLIPSRVAIREILKTIIFL